MSSGLTNALSRLKDTQGDLRESQSDLKVSQNESYHRLLELDLLYRTAPVGLAFLDNQLRYVRLNEVFAEINHLPVDDHIGQFASEINPELAKSVVPIMTKVLGTNTPLLNVEITGTTKAHLGSVRSWMACFHPVTNATIFGVSVVFHDVTDFKDSEHMRARLALLVESSDDAIISMTLNGEIESWNTAAETVFGYSKKEAVGQQMSLLARADNGNALTEILTRWQSTELVSKGERLEAVHRRKDGRPVAVASTVSPIHDRHGCLIGASQIVRDVTEQKDAQLALLRSNEELRQFAFAAAHDLQEPLRNISLYAQLLSARSTYKPDPEIDEPIGYMLESAQRMRMLVKDLLHYTEVIDLYGGESDKVIDCGEVCRAVLENLSVAIAECAAEVSVGPMPTVLSERTHLMQLFQNLIGNALKYRAKERHAHIQVSAALLDGRWTFSVKDNGIGIAPEYHGRIFGVFKRLHGRDVPGTGIGLAICKRIVDHHGGRLWLESEVGGGSTFYFTLP